jgi:oligopeptidase B
VSERSDGLSKIRIIPWNGEEEYYLPFESETYTAHATSNVDFDTDILRYAYQSMATPASIIDFNMKTREKVIRKNRKCLVVVLIRIIILRNVFGLPQRWNSGAYFYGL